MRFFYLVMWSIFLCNFAGCPRGNTEIDPHLIGKWRFVGDAMEQPKSNIVRTIGVGDHSWWIPPVIFFRDDGFINNFNLSLDTQDNSVGQWCMYRVVHIGELELDCQHGATSISYKVTEDSLVLDLGDRKFWAPVSSKVEFLKEN